MRAKAIAAVAAASAIAALLLPAGATARRPDGRHHPTVIAMTSFYGSNGYSVSVTLVNRRQLKIATFPVGGAAIVETEYELDAPQPRGSNRIKASLGRFGRIDLHFIPKSSNEVEALLPICGGEMDRVEVGEFVGRIEFHGEGGYTQVRRKRAFGTVVVGPAQACDNADPHRPRERPPHHRVLDGGARPAARIGPLELLLKAKQAHPTVSFEASRAVAPTRKGNEVPFDTFFALASRDFGRIHVESAAAEVFVHGPYFEVPDLLHPTTEAILKPRKPFLGSAVLQREPSGKVRWHGNLRVDLPGFGVVPLVGPKFTTTMCADYGCRSRR